MKRANGVPPAKPYLEVGQKWKFLTFDENPKKLTRYGFKVYSQSDEDGIIEKIFNRLNVKNKNFIEFGVQDGLETNTAKEIVI